jgi:hypothetical protein
LDLHRDIWPDVSYMRDIAVTLATLPSVLANAEDYDALAIDTQGAL